MQSARDAARERLKNRFGRSFEASDFAFDVKGRWRSQKRQVVEIRYRGEPLGALVLGPARWAVLAALVKVAIDFRSTGSADDGYLTKEEIAEVLQEVGSRFAYATHIKEYVHDLRRDLDAFLRHRLGPIDPAGGWGAFLLPTNALGYHLRVPASNLRLTILGPRQPR